MRFGFAPIVSLVASLLLLASLAVVVVVRANDVDLVLDVEHSLDDATTWTSRGKIKYVVNKQEKKLSVKFENPTYKLSSADVSKLSKHGAWVSVRIPAVDVDGKVIPGRFLVTSTKGCALLRDGKEVFSLLTDKTGALIGLQYDRPIASECPETPVGKGEMDITSKIVASLPKESQALPTKKIDMEVLTKGETAQKEQQSQQSFLQQYWYIILPSILVYTLMTAPQAPEDAPSGAAAAGAAGAAAAGVAAVAGAGASTTTGSGRKRKQ